MLDNRYALLFIRGERPDYVLLSEEDVEKEISVGTD
jgi:hypothetical protein